MIQTLDGWHYQEGPTDNKWQETSELNPPQFYWPVALVLKLDGPYGEAYDIEYGVKMNDGSAVDVQRNGM